MIEVLRFCSMFGLYFLGMYLKRKNPNGKWRACLFIVLIIGIVSLSFQIEGVLQNREDRMIERIQQEIKQEDKN